MYKVGDYVEIEYCDELCLCLVIEVKNDYYMLRNLKYALDHSNSSDYIKRKVTNAEVLKFKVCHV